MFVNYWSYDSVKTVSKVKYGDAFLCRALELTEEKREKYASLFLAKMAQMTDEEGKEYEK